MAAKIYAAPAEFVVPEITQFLTKGHLDLAGYDQAQDRYIAEVVAWCQKQHGAEHPAVGKLYRVGVADGYAQYVVFQAKPLTLIHLAVGDAWHMSEIHRRGMTLRDIK